MTLIETQAVPAAELPELPDGDAPPVGARRVATQISVGYHVRVEGRWLLVERVHIAEAWVVLWFAGAAMLSSAHGAMLWTRNPGEQIEYMAGLLPARDHYRPGRAIGTLYGGSANTLLAG